MCEYIQGSFFRALFNAAKKEQEHYNFIYSSFKFFFCSKISNTEQIHRREATNNMSNTKPERERKVIGTKLAIQDERQIKRVIPAGSTALCVFPDTSKGTLSRRHIHNALKSCETENTGKNNSRRWPPEEVRSTAVPVSSAALLSDIRDSWRHQTWLLRLGSDSSSTEPCSMRFHPSVAVVSAYVKRQSPFSMLPRGCP